MSKIFIGNVINFIGLYVASESMGLNYKSIFFQFGTTIFPTLAPHAYGIFENAGKLTGESTTWQNFGLALDT